MNPTLRLSASEEAALLRWAFSHRHAILLRGAGWKANAHPGDALLAFEARRWLDAGRGIPHLLEHYDPAEYWFGHFDYDLKNQLENLSSRNEDRVQFPATSFFAPHFLLRKQHGQWEVLRGIPDEGTLMARIRHFSRNGVAIAPEGIRLHARLDQGEYLDALDRVKEHIQRGDTYQVNFCQEFFAEEATIEPVELFEELFARMPNPYSTLYRCGDHYALSLSPEGFLSKTGNTLVSQPMKGTAPRSGVPAQDKAFREQLARSEKDRRENVMITDLVRNDLSHFAKRGSVVVDELCAVKTYPRVHQMISLVRCTLRPDVNNMEALLKAFPMGSMTGAPKIRAMEIIDALEVSRRGLYSGAIGCFDPAGDFDFNVVIRTLLYHAATHYLSCHVGGGITALSDPLAEYEECRVKLEPLRQFLEERSEAVATGIPL